MLTLNNVNWFLPVFEMHVLYLDHSIYNLFFRGEGLASFTQHHTYEIYEISYGNCLLLYVCAPPRSLFKERLTVQLLEEWSAVASNSHDIQGLP